MTTNVETDGIARGVLEELGDEHLVLAVPGTEYRLRLAAVADRSTLASHLGKRIKGRIHATALRMHTAQAGGRFIEPVWGAPRIVSGAVLTVDEAKDRLLVDVAVPMWVTVADGQHATDFGEGQMVNFYVTSGTSFEPIGLAG